MRDAPPFRVLVRSLNDFVDAGISYAESDAEKLAMIEMILTHLKKRRNEIRPEEKEEIVKEKPSAFTNKHAKKLRKKEKKKAYNS